MPSSDRTASRSCDSIPGDRVAALDLAVAGRRFLGADDPVAAVYADASACRSDRRMRAAPAE